MKTVITALIAGIIFGAGLAYSGMSDPARVQAFLDITGNWDPTLACVLCGALLPMMIAWRIQARMHAPFADAHFSLPGTTKLDGRLAIGAILFGIGWGIGGLCPGPAVADLAIAPQSAILFVAAMAAGMLIHRYAAS
ncbi:MAG: DUF6691 family protein [Sphingobium sp.]|jgi:hypothetical protein|nr:YeeE/YedE family protein [Sphingobium sp.]MCP5397891.1 YeeE/YedE family protein [Sphingomonas sp.]